MVRDALVALLNLEPDIEVVAAVASGTEILPMARRFRPDVAVIDIDLPGKDGLSAIADIQAHLPEIRTLVLTALGRPGTLRRALSAKATGFLLKDAPTEQLVDAIRSVAAGRRVVDSQLAMSAWDSAECPSRRARPKSSASRRRDSRPSTSRHRCSCQSAPSATT